MDLEKIEPGYYYKVVEKGLGTFSKCHIIHVVQKAGKLELRTDHGDYYEIDENTHYSFENMFIADRSTQPLPRKVRNARVIYRFEDEGGDPYEFEAKNAQMARKVVELFPILARALSIKKK